MNRRNFVFLASGVVISSLCGCSWWNEQTVRSQSPEDNVSHTKLVGDFAVPTGILPARVEGIGLVVGLRGTGGDPVPSPQRTALVDEMRKMGVENPNQVLASGNVALVMMQGAMRPGIQQGDRFDIKVRVPAQGDTTSLRGGILARARLTETDIQDNQVLTGNLLAYAQGPIMVDPSADAKKNRIAACEGWILGGGVAIGNRPLGLVLTPEFEDARISAKVATAINKRFNTIQTGHKDGMAEARDDKYINLKVHPHYKDNVARYIQVVRSLPVVEAAAERAKRIHLLEGQLLNPETSSVAALQLEAAGGDGVDTLLKGVQSQNLEIQFYSAEALAYLERHEAAEPLGKIARDEPPFRVYALAALGAMQDPTAADQLRGLLSSSSAETRYGAFRALWTMNKNHPLVRGEMFDNQFTYHVLNVDGPPMVHVTRSRLAEVVLFGSHQQFQLPIAVSAGNHIAIRDQENGQICVTKYAVGELDQKRAVSPCVDDVIRAVVDLGGTYPDVVQALQEAKKQGSLASRFEVDALPEAGRTYQRTAVGVNRSTDAAKAREMGQNAEQTATATPASPTPTLFEKKAAKGEKTADANPEEKSVKDSEVQPETKKGFFAKLWGG
jgi:flagellar basal body P-ring protein FlgI